MAKGKKKDTVIEPRINDEIRGYNDVRLIYKKHHGENSSEDFNKLTTLQEAKRIAERMNLDLVEINGRATPAILRVCDYSKYLFELKKSLKQKHKNTTTVKEVQLSVNITEHDMSIKAKKAESFITNGDKVKVVLTMKGRELSRRDISKKPIYMFVDMLSDVAIPESMPKDEGNKCVVILKKK